MSLPSAALLHYQARLQELQARLSDGLGKQTETFILLGVIVLAFGIISFFALARRNLPVWSPLLCIPPLAAVTQSIGRRRSDLYRLQRLQEFQERGIQRLEHRWQGSGPDGEEFEPASHPYAYDLNLFGRGSLFELLCTARTQIGQRCLASYLSEAPEIEETMRRQQAVQELRDRKALREEIALLGDYAKQQSSWDTLVRWLDRPPEPFHRATRMLAAILACGATTLGLVGLLGLAPAPLLIGALIPIAASEAIVALALRKRVRRTIADMQIVGIELGVLRQGLEFLLKQDFACLKLQGIVAQIGPDATPKLRHLQRLTAILDERHKDHFYYPSLLLLTGTQTAMAIENWRAQNHDALLRWMDAWGEFEALSALACYAFERRESTCVPQFAGGERVFEAQGLGHPLLSSEERVANDFALNSASRFYMISGSNMAGKSTLLRAIGTNAVLAMAGAPVTARTLRLSPFQVCASISVADSLLEGKSKFLAEVERLREAISSTQQTRPVLFLIDEIFGGTNSRDRRAAAEAVVRTLIEGGAVGAVSTHDLALTEIAEGAGLGGANLHMASRQGTDVLDFDYLLKPGVTPEANAVAIARLAGVPVGHG